MKLSVFVTGTATLGFMTAGPPISVPALLGVTLGTYLCSASAGTWNQIYEIKNDSLMTRTRARPLPSGRLSPAHAAAFGATAGLAGVGLLAAACNPLTAALGAANIGLYSLVYTPMKQKTIWNTEVGAIVGAIPPLMGWAACTGSITADPAGVALFAALFLWQMPHFYALAWRHRRDYEVGGYQMVSLGDRGGARTAARTLFYSAGLAAFPVATTLAGVTGPMFLLEASAANVLFLRKAWQFYRDPTDDTARGVFFASLWYLPVLMLCLAFHSHRWKKVTADEEDRLADAAAAGAGQDVDARERTARWLDEVDLGLATAFADDPASRWLSSGLSATAARARRVLRSHCPHEMLVAASGGAEDTAGGKEQPAQAFATAAANRACPVTHQTQASAANAAKSLPCPVVEVESAAQSARDKVAAPDSRAA